MTKNISLHGSRGKTVLKGSTNENYFHHVKNMFL